MKFPMVKFGELYAEPVRNGLTRPTRVRGAGYRMVNMGELFAFDRINGQEMELVPLNERELRVATLNEGDLLFARSSLKMEGTGKCSIVAGVPETTTFESHLIRARLNTEIADPRFYFYYFQSRHGRTTVLSIAKQVGAAGLAGSQLGTLSIPFPSLSTQSATADILWQYDDLIDNNNRRIKLLEDAARLLYDEWFVRLRFPGHEHTPVNDGVPEGWERRPFSSLADFMNGFAFKPIHLGDTGLPIVKIPELRAGPLTKTPRNDGKLVPDRYRVDTGDILFSWSGTLLVNIWSWGPALLNQHLFKVTTCEAEHRGLVYLGLIHALEAFHNQTTGATMKHFRKGALDTICTLVPPVMLAREFESVIGPLLDQRTILRRQNGMAAAARDLLLPRLMSGEVAV